MPLVACLLYAADTASESHVTREAGQCSKMEKKQLSGSPKRKLKRINDLKFVNNLKHKPKPQIAHFFTPNDQCPLRKGDGIAEIILPSPVEIASVNVKVSGASGVEGSSETRDDSQLSQEQEDDEDEQPPRHHNEHDASPTEGAETAGSSSPRSTFTLPSDPALWGPLTETLREEAIHRGPSAFHNRASRYPASVRESGLGCRTRSLTNDLFNCRLQNNEVVPREWLFTIYWLCLLSCLQTPVTPNPTKCLHQWI